MYKIEKMEVKEKEVAKIEVNRKFELKGQKFASGRKAELIESN